MFPPRQGLVRKTERDEMSRTTSHMFIVKPLGGRGLAGLFSTHPPIEERVARLRGTR
jgi:Zn-dependent protease with chaperone function